MGMVQSQKSGNEVYKVGWVKLVICKKVKMEEF